MSSSSAELEEGNPEEAGVGAGLESTGRISGWNIA
jgi:hypothetical protein